MSVRNDGTDPEDGPSQAHNRRPVSDDGRYVVFWSYADNLDSVVPDTNGAADIFLRDVQTDETTRLTVNTDGEEGNGDSSSPVISGDGRFVAFVSYTTNLTTLPCGNCLLLYDRDTEPGQNPFSAVSVDSEGANESGASPDMSSDGRYFAFASTYAYDADDDNLGEDVYVRDHETNETVWVSFGPGRQPPTCSCGDPGISDDGRYVVFYSLANNLDFVIPDNNGVYDMFVHDRETGTTRRVSISSSGEEGNDGSSVGAISGDGTWVVFASYASNLVEGDTNGVLDVFVHSLQTGDTRRISLDSAGLQAEGESGSVEISKTGRYVVFSSTARNLALPDSENYREMLIHDRDTDDDGVFDEVGNSATTRVSVSNECAEAGAVCDGYPGISADGRYVVFDSFACNLAVGGCGSPDSCPSEGDCNGLQDIYLRDRDDCAVPSVTQHPIAPVGPWHTKGEYTLDAAAIGDEPLSYQWYKNDVALVDDGRITGSQTSMLTVSNVKFADAGSYRATVRNECTCDPGLCECEGEECLCGRADSATVEITVICPGDANQDGAGDPLDSGFVLARLGCTYPKDGENCLLSDQNGDGEVDPLDVGYVLARFGECEE